MGVPNTKRVAAVPKADTAIDYDNLLRANANRIFSEPDVQQRLTALKELWAEKGVLLENEQVFSGWDTVSNSAGALLKKLPPGTTFEPAGEGREHYSAALRKSFQCGRRDSDLCTYSDEMGHFGSITQMEADHAFLD